MGHLGRTGGGATRRQILAASAGVGLTLALGRQRLRAAGEVKVGFQKGSATLLVLKSSGDLEKRLGDLGPLLRPGGGGFRRAHRCHERERRAAAVAASFLLLQPDSLFVNQRGS